MSGNLATLRLQNNLLAGAYTGATLEAALADAKTLAALRLLADQRLALKTLLKSPQAVAALMPSATAFPILLAADGAAAGILSSPVAFSTVFSGASTANALKFTANAAAQALVAGSATHQNTLAGSATALSAAYQAPGMVAALFGGATRLVLAANPEALTLSNGKVTQWTDASGYGGHATMGSGDVAPTVTNAAINGWPAVTFSRSAAQRLTVAAPTATYQGHFSCFAVARRNSFSTTDVLINNSVNPAGVGFSAAASSTNYLAASTPGGSPTYSSPVAPGGFSLLSFASTPNTNYYAEVGVNGTFRAQITGAQIYFSPAGAQIFRIGGPAPSSPWNYLDGAIAELVLIDGYVGYTSADYERITRVLLTKYGITRGASA